MLDDIADCIYEAAFVPDQWHNVFDRLAACAGGASGTLVIYAGDELSSYRASPLIEASVHEFVRLGAWKQSARALSVNTPLGFEHSIRWITPEEFLPPEVIETDAAQKLLRARGMEAQVGTGVPMMSGEVAAFSVERWREDGPFPAESIAALNTLRPHLARASLIATRLGLERAQNAVDIMEKLGLPVATMTLRGRVLAANALLEALPQVFMARAAAALCCHPMKLTPCCVKHWCPFGPALPDALVIAQSETNWLTTFTARLGYAVDRSLFYIKGGVAAGAFSELYTIDDPTGILTGSVDSTRVGWTAGAGLEYALLPNWSIKIEYNYLDFEAKRQTITTNLAGVTLGFDQDIDHRLHLVKAGINYKFSSGYR